MLKTWLVLRAPDANTETASSTVSDDKGQESSPEQTDAQEVSTEAVEEPAEVETESDEPSTDANENEETHEEKTTQEGEATNETALPLDKPEDEKLPFHKEPRFQELVREKNTFKQENETLKPLAQRAKILDDYVTTNGISSQELTGALEYLRMRRQDPAKAFELLKADYNALAMYAGEQLPPDLQAEVAAGTLSPERAKQLVQAQAKMQHQQFLQQSGSQTQAQMQETAIQGSIDLWEQATMARDPDLKPKAPNSVDGKWEYVDMKLRSLRQANPPRSPQEAVALAEKAYSEANKFFGTFRQQRIVKKPIQSQQSSQNANAVVKTAEDVTRAILGGKRPHQLRYS